MKMCVSENVTNMTIRLDMFYAQVQDLDCDGIDNAFTVAGTDVTFACTITSMPIRGTSSLLMLKSILIPLMIILVFSIHS